MVRGIEHVSVVGDAEVGAGGEDISHEVVNRHQCAPAVLEHISYDL